MSIKSSFFSPSSGDLGFSLSLEPYHLYSNLEVCQKCAKAECCPQDQRFELASLSEDDYRGLLEVFRNVFRNAENPGYFADLRMCRQALAGRICPDSLCPLAHSVAERIARGFYFFPHQFEMRECVEPCDEKECCALHVGEWDVTIDDRGDFVFRRYIDNLQNMFNFLSDSESESGEPVAPSATPQSAAPSPAETTEHSDS